MSEQPAGHVGRIRDRGLAGSQFARAQSSDGALARNPPDLLGAVELARITRAAVPIVTLHLGGVLRDQRAVYGMTRACRAGEKAERVAVHADVALGVDRGTLGIGDTGIDRKTGRFT